MLSKELVRYNFIDSLRGWAIIGVLLAHTSIVGNVAYPSWLRNITYLNVAPRGVQLFFVVSALTLCMSWTKRKEKEKYFLRNFYIRRFFRIAPLFYLAIIYFLFIQGYWNGNLNHFSFANIFTTFFFVNGVFPAWMNNIVYGGWTIAVEMMFYALFPLLVYTIRSVRVAMIVTFASMIVGQILRLSLNTSPFLSQAYSTYTFEFFPSQFPVFLIGITTFLLSQEKLTKKDKKFLFFSLVIFIVILVFQFLFRIPIIAGHYLYGIFFGLLAYFLFVKPIKLFVNAMIIHIGKVSYSMYLCHIPTLWLMEKYNLIDFFPNMPVLNFVVRFLMLLIFSSSIATILFYIIERPVQLLGKMLIDHSERKETTDLNVAMETW